MAAEDEELKVSKQKAKQKFDELASTTSAIMDALNRFGASTEASSKAVNDAKDALKDQEVQSRRVKESLGIWSGTLYGIIQVGRQEIETARKKTKIAEAEVSQAQQVIDETKKRIQSIQGIIERTKQGIKVQEDEIAAKQQQIAQVKESIRYTQSTLSAAQSERQAIEARVSALQETEAATRSELDAVNEAINRRGELEQQGVAISEEAFYSLAEQQYSLMEKLQQTQQQVEAEISTRDNLNSEIENLERLLANETAAVGGLTEQEQALKSELEKRRGTLAKLEANEKALSDSLPGLEKAALDRAEKLKAARENEVNKKIDLLQKGFSQAAQTIGKVANELNKLVDVVRKTQQQFGLSAGSAAKLEFGILSASIKSYAQSLITAGKVIPVSREEIKAATEAYQQEFGGVLTPEAAADIAGQAKKMGVTASALATARRQFLTQTMGDAGKARSAEQKFIGEFAKKGLTSKEALEAIGKYSEIYARNGGRFAASFARAAAEAKKIGVDLGKIDQVGDNIIGDFEGFLEKTAELGAMGFNFDSSRLAEIAESGDTGALMDELRSQLAAQGKDLNNLRRSEQLALSQAFGIPMAELQRLAAPKKEDTESASGEKVLPPNELDADSNSKLGQLVNLMQTAGVILGVISAAVALIASKMVMGGLKDLLMRRGGGGRRGGRGARARTPRPGRPPRATGGTTRMGSIASRATGAARRATTAVASRGGSVLRGLGKVARVGLRAGKAIPVVGQALALGMGAYDAFTGFNADPNATTGQKFKNAGSSMLSGLTFGLLGKDASEIRESALARGPAAPVRRSEQLAVARATGLPVAGAAVAGTVAAATTAPTTPTAPSVDFTKLEQKLDQVVRAIGAMKVELDGVKVGRVVAASAASTQQVGVFSRST